MMICTRINMGVLVLTGLLAVGCQSAGTQTSLAAEASSGNSTSADSPPASTNTHSVRGAEPPPANTLTAHFQAAVYEVQATSGRVDTLDGKSLVRRAATAEDLLKALSGYGTAKILYRFDQPVNVFGESLMLGSSEPLVTGTRTSPRGQAINTVTYHNVGAIFRLSARTPPKEAKSKALQVTVSLQLSVLGSSGAEIVAGQKATAIRTLSTEHHEQLEYGKPRVMVAVSSTSADEKQPPVMYVVRYVFGR